MFVLLEHHTAAPPGVHWDLLIQVPGQELLAAWRLTENPIDRAAPTPAQRLPDHRPLYLDYEGEISRNRGTVLRLDRGDAVVREYGGETITVELRGRNLCDEFVVARDADRRLLFQRDR